MSLRIKKGERIFWIFNFPHEKWIISHSSTIRTGKLLAGHNTRSHEMMRAGEREGLDKPGGPWYGDTYSQAWGDEHTASTWMALKLKDFGEYWYYIYPLASLRLKKNVELTTSYLIQSSNPPPCVLRWPLTWAKECAPRYDRSWSTLWNYNNQERLTATHKV